MSIEKMLVISTVHITLEVADQLNATCDQDVSNFATFTRSDWIDDLIVYPHGEYGWLIRLGESGEDVDLPEPLADALEQARCEGCDWLLIDRDGPEHNLLETFEW